MARQPSYCRHKPTNQAYVNLGGQVVYLGELGSEKSKDRYTRLKAEWLLNPHCVKVVESIRLSVHGGRLLGESGSRRDVLQGAL